MFRFRRGAKIREFVGVGGQVEQHRPVALEQHVFPTAVRNHAHPCVARLGGERDARILEGEVVFADHVFAPGGGAQTEQQWAQ
ncbi:hypothetical protein D9M68_618280 [compost metagenome]